MTRQSTSRQIRERKAVSLVALVALVALWLPTAAGAARASTVTLKGCHFGLNVVEVPMKNIQIMDGDKGNDRVPERYPVLSYSATPARGSDKAYLLVDPFACESVKLAPEGWTTGPVRSAFVAVEICPEETTGSQCHALSEPNRHSYVLFVVTDNEAYAEWLRGQTDLDVFYEPKIRHDFTQPNGGVAPYLFEVQQGPASFEVNGALASQNVLGVRRGDGEGGWLQDTQEGTVVLEYKRHDNYFASGNMTITAPEGSELAKIMGTRIAKPASVGHGIPSFDLVRTVTPLPRGSQG